MFLSAGTRIISSHHWVVPLKSWCFINSWGNEAQRGEGAFLMSHSKGVVRLGLQACLFSWALISCDSPSGLSCLWVPSTGSTCPEQACLWVMSYPFSNLEHSCGPAPWLMPCAQPDITLCIVHLLMCQDASYFHIATQCPILVLRGPGFCLSPVSRGKLPACLSDQSVCASGQNGWK